MRLRKIIILLLLSCSLFAQRKDNNYPLLFNLTWGGGADWWQNQFHWVMTVPPDSNLAKRCINAFGHQDSTYWSMTADFNIGQPLSQLAIDASWRVRDYLGNYLNAYGDGQYLIDITNYCPQIGGRRFNQTLADTLAIMANPNYWDGVNSDGTWAFPYAWLASVDLDRNGLADYSEIAKGATPELRQAWICQTWAAGYYSFATRLKAKTGWSNKLITYWTVRDSMGMHAFNGAGWENAPQNAPVTFDRAFPDAAINGYNSWKQIVDDWNSISSPSPRINFLSVSMAPDAGLKTWYRYMMWTLAMAMIGDAYYCIQEAGQGSGAYDHATVYYYDEFKSNLGSPTVGGLHQILTDVWVKYFQNGCMIMYAPQTSTASKTVNLSDISGLSGYAGPYYRIFGNQDTIKNTGAIFTSAVFTASSSVRWQQPIGDAIILKRSRDTVVCDVIVDNSYTATTPGSNQASVTSGFVWDAEANGSGLVDPLRSIALDYNPTFNTGYRSSTDPRWYRSLYCQNQAGQTGLGSQVATFTPGLNRAGWYRVYEWHGWRGADSTSYSEGTDIPFRISYQTGFKDTTINQRVNSGRWNLLGTYYFTPTGNKSVQIGNNTATGYIIADAIRFEFIHGTSQAVVPPPPPPLPDSSFKRKTLVKRRGT